MIPEKVLLVNEETPAVDDEFLILGNDDNFKFSYVGIQYYVNCTGNDYEEEEVMTWNSLHIYLVKKVIK